VICCHFPWLARPTVKGLRLRDVFLGALALGNLFWTSGCYSSHTVNSHTDIKYKYPPPLRAPQGISLVAPTVGLFIGVSEYAERSGMNPTPAHTLSAALMYSPFFNAATKAETDDRKNALGIPDDNYFQDHSKTVCAVAFSPDGARFATASTDGTVTLRPSDLSGGPVQLRPALEKGSTDVCVLAFSPDGSRLVTGNSDGTISIWPMKANGEPTILRPRKPVRSVIYSADGSRLLTTSYGEAARIWPADGNTQPLELPSDKQCLDVPPAAFSPDGRYVGNSGCFDVRIAAADDLSTLRTLGRPGSVNSLAFSPDGSRIVTTAWDGIRIWPVVGTDPPKLLPILTGQSGSAGPAQSAIFSPDGSLVAVGYAKGYVQVWQADGSREPITLGSYGTGVKSLAFSADGKYLLKVSDTGTAWVRDVAARQPAMFLPRPAAPKGKWDGIATSEALKKGKLPPRPPQLAIRAAAFSPDADRVVVGYSDGTVAMQPGVHPNPKRAFRADDLTLLADLEVSADTPNSDLAIQYLIQLDGIPQQMSSFRAAKSPENSTVYYVGSGKPVTRQRILDSLSRSIANAARTLELQHRVVFVAYVSAHGWIGPDGRQYLLPADADSDDPTTWISYEEFLQPIRAFLANENKDSPFYDPFRGDMGRLAIVIFDTCQVARSGELQQISAPDLSQRGLLVVQATSPGRYAWHWTGTLTTTGNTTIEKESRWGFPPPPKAKRGPISTTLSTNMSVLPVASQNVLNDLQASKIPGSAPIVGTLIQPDEASMISAAEWVTETRRAVDRLLAQIPEASNPELKGKAAQEVQVQADPRQYDFWIFRVTSVKKSVSPPEKEDGTEPES
jgi:WD40 repeat protein